MDKHKFAAYRSTEAILRRQRIDAHRMRVKLSKMTRRILRIAARQQRILARIEKIRRKSLDRVAEQQLRRAVQKLCGQRRKPHMRSRERDNYGAIQFPEFTYCTVTGQPVSYPTNGWGAYCGEYGHMTDFSPTANTSPLRNPMWAGRQRTNSLSASARLDNQGTYKYITVPKCKFGLYGLRVFTLSLNVQENISIEDGWANDVLIKALAKINEADICLNEYLVEWKQVFSLLKDPYRTVLRSYRLLERWTRRDAWIWIPQRTCRRMTNGDLLVSRAPLGGVLMSARTRKTVSVSEVSKPIFEEACNRWLQYRYGIMPLAMDITKVMGDWLQPKLTSEWKDVSARVKVSQSRKVIEHAYTVSPLVMKFIATQDKGEFYSAKQRYKLLEEPPMKFKLGIHPTQWLNVLWNALPYSFVADWVVNVDDWLKATTDIPWIKLGGNEVTRKQYERVQSRLVDMHTTSSVSHKFVVTGDPMAISYRENVCRKLDLPRPTGLPVSSAWRSIKNVITGLTLLPGVCGVVNRKRR